MKLKIIAPGIVGPDEHKGGTKIFLDNKELKYVTAINVDMAIDRVNMATISFFPTEIDIEGEFEIEMNPENKKDDNENDKER